MSMDRDQLMALQRLKRETELGTIDLRSQMRDEKQNFLMGREERGRQFGRSKANLGNQMNARGLGWSGVKAGAQGRALEDFTTGEGMATVGHQQERDALKRALQRMRADAALREQEIMSQGLS